MATRLEWDHAKNLSNQADHGLSFEIASHVFEDPFSLSAQDRHENGEERWQTLGAVAGMLILLVAHTVREDDGLGSFRRVRPPAGKESDMSKLSKKQLDEIKALSVLPDATIDSTDIPDTADWTKAVHGRFYRPGISTQIPVYLEPDLMEFLAERADRRRIDTASLVNELLRKDVELIRAAG